MQNLAQLTADGKEFKERNLWRVWKEVGVLGSCGGLGVKSFVLTIHIASLTSLYFVKLKDLTPFTSLPN